MCHLPEDLRTNVDKYDKIVYTLVSRWEMLIPITIITNQISINKNSIALTKTKHCCVVLASGFSGHLFWYTDGSKTND